jgi:hypothetical protein
MKGKKEQRKGRQKKEKKVNTSQEIWKGWQMRSWKICAKNMD